jgi:hypothetical protein
MRQTTTTGEHEMKATKHIGEVISLVVLTSWTVATVLLLTIWLIGGFE